MRKKATAIEEQSTKDTQRHKDGTFYIDPIFGTLG